MSPTPASPTAADPPLGLEPPRRHWAVAVQVTGIIIAVLDSSSVSVALPTIAAALDTAPSVAVRITNIYNLTMLVLLLPLAALGERIGLRRVFGAGLLIFALASLACALSRSIEMLAAARVLQGVGSAAMMSMMGGLVRHIYPPAIFGRGIGMNAMIVAVGGAAGPSVTSAVLSVADWPWLFALNIPLALIAFAGVRCLPESRRHPRRFDGWGAVHTAVVLILIVLGLERLTSATWLALGLIALGLVLGRSLVRRQGGHATPLVPVDLYRLPPFAYASAASFFSFAAQMGAFVALPFHFQHAFGRDQIATGLLMTAWPIAGGIMAPIAGRLADHYSAAWLSGIGACVMAFGLAVIALLPAGSADGWIIAAMALGGVGFGFFQSPNNRAMLMAVPIARSGAAGGAQATTRTFGQCVGVATVGIALSLGGATGTTVAVGAGALFGLAAAGVNLARLRALR